MCIIGGNLFAVPQESLMIKFCQDAATSSFISCCFTSSFTSADTIFYSFLEICSILSEKKIFITSFPFLTEWPKPLTLLMAKISQVWQKFFVNAPLFEIVISYQFFCQFLIEGANFKSKGFFC